MLARPLKANPPAGSKNQSGVYERSGARIRLADLRGFEFRHGLGDMAILDLHSYQRVA